MNNKRTFRQRAWSAVSFGENEIMKSALLGLAVFASSVGAALAQSYPTKPVHFVIPYVAGASSNDIMGRALAARLSSGLGQTVIVDNKPGAAGNLGGEFVAKAAPDGYTLLMGINGPMAISPTIETKLGYDSVRDLAHIALVAKVPYMVVISPTLKVKNLKEFIALAKSRPGKVNYGSTGVGGTPHLCIELLKDSAKLDMLHVPYKGGAQVVQDLLGGRVDMYCAGFSALANLVQSGKVVGLGSATLKRSDLLPGLPTFIEQGIPDYEVGSWFGVNAPAKTPQPIINRLYQEIAKVVNSAEFKKYLLSQGAEPALLNPKEYGEYVKAEIVKWAKVIKLAGIKKE